VTKKRGCKRREPEEGKNVGVRLVLKLLKGKWDLRRRRGSSVQTIIKERTGRRTAMEGTWSKRRGVGYGVTESLSCRELKKVPEKLFPGTEKTSERGRWG